MRGIKVDVITIQALFSFSWSCLHFQEPKNPEQFPALFTSLPVLATAGLGMRWTTGPRASLDWPMPPDSYRNRLVSTVHELDSGPRLFPPVSRWKRHHRKKNIEPMRGRGKKIHRLFTIPTTQFSRPATSLPVVSLESLGHIQILIYPIGLLFR